MTYEHDPLTHAIIGAAIEVHKELGPGLLESAYQICLAHEMRLRKLSFEMEKRLPIVYKGTALDAQYRVDFYVENRVVVELKSVEHLLKVHEAQVLTYMRLLKSPVGLLINFNVETLKEGLKRLAL